MKVEIFTVCRSANMNGNQLNIQGASELFTSTKPQSVLAECFLVYRLRFEIGEEGTHSLKITITDNDGKTVKQFSKNDVSVMARPDGGFVPNIGIIPLKGIVLPKLGEFSISIYGDNQQLASIPIYCIPASKSE